MRWLVFFLSISFLGIGLYCSSLWAEEVSPMERLLKRQIAVERIKRMRAGELAEGEGVGVKDKTETKTKVEAMEGVGLVKRPPYRVVMVMGLGGALYADLVVSKNMGGGGLKNLGDGVGLGELGDILRVRRGDRLDYGGYSYEVVAISEAGVVLGYGVRRWLLSFVPFAVQGGG